MTLDVMSSDDLKEKKRRRRIKTKRQISSSSKDLCLKEKENVLQIKADKIILSFPQKKFTSID